MRAYQFRHSRSACTSGAIALPYAAVAMKQPGPGFDADEDIVPDVDLADAADLLARLMEIGV
jgi:hypothetical protein